MHGVLFAPYNKEIQMKLNRPAFLGAAAVALAALASSPAMARSDVAWSIGINAAPGLSIGATNAPYYAQPAPVYVPQPVYSQPVYPSNYYVQSAPVYVQPAPIYYRPAPVYYGPHFRHGHGPRGHGHGHRR